MEKDKDKIQPGFTTENKVINEEYWKKEADNIKSKNRLRKKDIEAKISNLQKQFDELTEMDDNYE